MSISPRNLVLLCDGTNNEVKQDLTNVQWPKGGAFVTVRFTAVHRQVLSGPDVRGG